MNAPFRVGVLALALGAGAAHAQLCFGPVSLPVGDGAIGVFGGDLDTDVVTTGGTA